MRQHRTLVDDAPQGAFQRTFALVRSGLSLRRAYRRQATAREPAAIVILNDRADSIARRAESLAETGREDAQAVADLVKLAGRHMRDLRGAALSFQQDGWDQESRVADHARRLIEAALSGQPVAPVGAEAEKLFRQLDAWDREDRPTRFRQLVQHEPELAAIEAAVRSGEYGHVGADETTWGPDERERVGTLRLRVEALIGPGGRHADHPVLRSAGVGADALFHLVELMQNRSDK